ncbi:hypothetical protein HNQ36_003045 [Afipia massiliensis]|uniref:Uncharacterized protein n=1 Tax=Afipia massiliensis TaxID=211460 RepID=A0A840N375_9BRAD|nr:hypothetical protein [Afipia massiliensis]MBB5053054.1 hypothetical protein [Afipia massiliensis]
MIKAANDNKPKRHISDPFHRLYKEGLLHQNEQTNRDLYYVGERYRKNYLSKPEIECDGYDSFRDRPIPDHLNKSKLYSAAAASLDVIESRGLFEDIVVHGMPVFETSRKHTGRNQRAQAVAAAITVLTSSLLLLRDHYTKSGPELPMHSLFRLRARNTPQKLAKSNF